jgi:hypothetical protein
MVDYYVEYAQPPWPRLDDFIGKVADTFHLPPASNWTTENSAHKKLACDGFRIQAVTHDYRAALKVTTGDDPMKIRSDRRAASEEKQRRDLKP